MPNLLNFIKQNGTLDAGDHVVLISHTANDILTTQTGLYSDDDGIAVANNFGVFDPGGVAFPSSFFYWTDLVTPTTPRQRSLILAPHRRNVRIVARRLTLANGNSGRFPWRSASSAMATF